MRERELTAIAFDQARPRTAQRSAEHWLVLAAGVAVVLGLVALGLFLQPDPRGYGTHERLGLRPCMPMELWNVPCPGCGVTTAVVHAARGEIWASIRTQPFGFLVALGLAGFGVWTVVGQVRGRDLWVDLHRWPWSRWMPIAAVLMGLGWLYKLAVVRGWGLF